MKISSISDVHIKHSGDKPFELLEKFFLHENVMESDLIVLNGDIFDILIGGKTQYLNKYKAFFELVKSATQRGTRVVYIEGNHDFHTKRVISKSLKKFSINSDLFIHVKNNYTITVDDKIIVFTHGDDIEIENEPYQKYKSKINNPFMKILGDYIIPFSLIEWVGHRASKNSRMSNESRYELSEVGQKFVKDKFRKSADIYFEENSETSMLVCGHSHCKDLYIKNDHCYVNNGYAPRTKSFIYITKSGSEFIDL
jgi:UDP-2,3-diacylglucosamine hydrolase